MKKSVKYILISLSIILGLMLFWFVLQIFHVGYGQGTIEKLNNPSLEKCESIPSNEYGTFLFNPSGYEIYYHRSNCYYKLATVPSADEQLCDKVIEKKSLFFDGSAISPEGCREKRSENLAMFGNY